MGQYCVVIFGSSGTYKSRVIVGGARCLHAAEGNTLDSWQNTVFTDKPICISSLGVEDVVLDHNTKDIGDVLIESAGLALVVKRACVLSDGMCNLVSNDIDAAREVIQKAATITVNHLSLLRVPDYNYEQRGLVFW